MQANTQPLSPDVDEVAKKELTELIRANVASLGTAEDQTSGLLRREGVAETIYRAARAIASPRQDRRESCRLLAR